jgi:hypothetical protein
MLKLCFSRINFGVVAKTPQAVTVVSAKFSVVIDIFHRRMGIGQSILIRKSRVRGAQLTAIFSRLWLYCPPGMASRTSAQSRAALRCNRGRPRRRNDARYQASNLLSGPARVDPLSNLWRAPRLPPHPDPPYWLLLLEMLSGVPAETRGEGVNGNARVSHAISPRAPTFS